MNRHHHRLMPVFAVLLGIATFSLMDGLMKSAALMIGAYSAMFWRSLCGVGLMYPVWKLGGGRWPQHEVLKLHALRGFISAIMATSFFWALKYLPLAEGMAISFIAPLIALYLAAVLLGEKIGPRAIYASLLGLCGVLVIVAGRFGESGYDPDIAWGIAAILFSAVAYAFNLILQRRQAQLADPREIALFQALFTGSFLALFAPWLATWPPQAAWFDIAGSAVLAAFSLMVISWAYAREETQVLLPLEYSAFIWAALFGWMLFGETLTLSMIAGAVLIVAGCLIASQKHIEQTAL